MIERDSRRAFLSMAGASVLWSACRTGDRSGTEPMGVAVPTSAPTTNSGPAPKPDDDKDDGKEVGAVEDMMREHGVIRRVLVVYRDAAARLRVKPSSISPDALQKAANLMRSFGEDYHEKQLEEANVFPALAKRATLATVTQTLIAQHQRGREITEYVLAVTRKTIGAANAEPLAKSLEAFARMYEEHAAMEDTIVFPAWKKALSAKELEEQGDLFEDIEHKTFGKDGFDAALAQIDSIESALGIQLAAFMAPAPPKV